MNEIPADEVIVARRFHGPAGSGNGGYTAGVLANAHRRATADRSRAVTVTLRVPPPLDTPMGVRYDAATTVLHTADGQTVAEARHGELGTDPVEAVSLADARDAETSYAGLAAHPFPTCFTCGPEREHGDGLRLQPGRIGGDRTACTWTPEDWVSSPEEPTAVAPEFVWAALDCPGGWTADLEGRPMVLGRITAEVDAPAEVGERHVIVGRLLDHDGRKTFTATTLYDSDGRVVARAEHVWIAVDPATFS